MTGTIINYFLNHSRNSEKNRDWIRVQFLFCTFFYEQTPVLLQVMVSDLFTVLIGMPAKYRFTVKLPVALLPLFDALEEVTFQWSSYILYDLVAFVQVAELPVYVKVPVKYTLHSRSPSEL